MAFDNDARYSPDGQSIVFVSDRSGAQNLWLASTDGSDLRQLTNNMQRNLFATPIWAADGMSVIAAKATNRFLPYDLYRYPLNGEQVERLTFAPAVGPEVRKNVRSISGTSMDPTAVPDGSAIIFARNTGGFRGTWKLIKLDMETGAEIVLVDDHDRFGGFRPRVSPDGATLVYGKAGLDARGQPAAEAEVSLYVRDLTSGEESLLAGQAAMPDQGTFNRGVLPGYAFVSNREIILSLNGKLVRMNLQTADRKEIPFTANIELAVRSPLRPSVRVPDGKNVRANRIHAATESPDGDRLAFSAFGHIYVMEIPSGLPTRLTSNPISTEEYQPVWSPDGRWLAYVSWSEAATCQLWKARADGSGQPHLVSTEPGLYMDPTWSPDGTKLLVMHRADGQWKFVPRWLPTDGQDAVAGMASTGLEGLERPHFVFNDDRVYFASKGALVSVESNGDGSKRHFQALEAGWREQQALYPATDVRISPTGEWVLGYANRQLYLFPRAKAEQEQSVNLKQPPEWVRQLTAIGADDFGWSADGSRIHWNVGSTFYRASLEDVLPRTGRVEQIPISVEIPRYRPEGILALRGARLLSMDDDGRVIESGDVLIRNNRIAAIGVTGSVAVPFEATVIDMKGKTIMPGMFDMHGLRGSPLIPEKVLGLGANHWQVQGMLALGVTAIRGANGNNDDFVRQDLLDARVLLGPRLVAEGEAVHSKHFRSLDEARQVARKYVEHYHSYLLKSYLVGNRLQRQWWVIATQEIGLAISGEMGGDMHLSMTYPVDGFSGFEHTYPAKPVYEDFIRLHAASGMFWDVTIVQDEPYWKAYFEQTTNVLNLPMVRNFTPDAWIARSRLGNLREADGKVDARHLNRPYVAIDVGKVARTGGHIVTGSHGEWGGRGYTAELWTLHAMGQGLDAHGVLRAATIDSARALGMDVDLGSLEEGKMADLVVLSANPLDALENLNGVEYVMKNGELFTAAELSRVWPDVQ